MFDTGTGFLVRYRYFAIKGFKVLVGNLLVKDIIVVVPVLAGGWSS